MDGNQFGRDLRNALIASAIVIALIAVAVGFGLGYLLGLPR